MSGWQIDEGVREQAIAAIDVATLTGSPRLQAITAFAGALCDAPIALVSLVERNWQRFVAQTGST